MITDLDKIAWDFKESKNSLMNSIHPYPAKFIPDIPSALIDALNPSKEYPILDPFCGSGVTLQSAQERGLKSIGVDLNPIACLISRVKTRALPEKFLECCKAIVDCCLNRVDKPYIPEFSNRDHWFNPDIQIALGYLINEIDKYTDPSFNDALRFCFSSIIVKVSNQDSDTRYAYKDKQKKANDVYNSFISSAKRLCKAKKSIQSEIEPLVINKNSLTLSETDFPSKIGCVITSPPYPNAYEYWLYHKFRMIWLGYEPQSVKSEEIGTRSSYFKGKIAKEEIYDFAIQIKTLLSFLHRVIIPKAYLCFVIGRSKIHGKIYNNDEIIIQAASEVGLKHIKTIPRTINSGRKSFNLSHARIKEEYIVILQK